MIGLAFDGLYGGGQTGLATGGYYVYTAQGGGQLPQVPLPLCVPLPVVVSGASLVPQLAEVKEIQEIVPVIAGSKACT